MLQMHMTTCVPETLQEDAPEADEDKTDKHGGLICKYCRFVGKTSLKLFKHIKREHNNMDGSISKENGKEKTEQLEEEKSTKKLFRVICKFCSYTAKSRSKLKEHMN